MDPVVEPEVAALHDVAGRLQETGALAPAPLPTITRRAHRLRARRRVGTGLAVAMAALVVAGAALARPGPGQGVEYAGPGMEGSAAAPGGTGPQGVPGEGQGSCRRTSDLIVFLDPRATDDHIAGVGRYLDDQPAVRLVAFVNQRQAYAEFRELFRDSPEMIDSVTPEVLPTSFRVDAGGDDAAIAALVTRSRDLAGVREVVTDPERRCREYLSQFVPG